MNFIQRYQPLTSWAHEFDRFFDRNRLAVPSGPRETFHESDDAWILRLDLPGFGKSDVTLNVTGRTLKLIAETPADRPFGGKVEREWKLGDDINAPAIGARLENGVLELTLPKLPEAGKQPVKIEIQ